jgi:glycerate-2-kinase
MIDVEKLSDVSKQNLAKARKDILSAFNAALESVDPYKSVLNFVKVENGVLFAKGKPFELTNFNKIRLVAFGKASIRMAEAILSMIDVDEGVVVSPEEGAHQFKNVEYIRGGHPIPNENSLKAGTVVLDLARKTKERDLTIVLISGGGSALVESPLVSLDELQKVTKMLMQRGADINELNTVRKHLSRIKGGRLLKTMKGTVLSFIISDVIKDPLDVIASGPTFYDSSTYADALAVLKKYNLDEEFKDVVSIFEKGIAGGFEETLKREDKIECSFENFLVATNSIATKTIVHCLQGLGYAVLYLGSSIEGITSEVAKVIAGIGHSISVGDIALKLPAAIVFGGETTVVVKGNGVGGRNTEFTLQMTTLIKTFNFVFASIGTDGIDGVSPAAGAISDSLTIERANAMCLNPKEYLERNDSYTFFEQLGDAIITGPTGTNVADVAVLLIL